MGNKKYRNKEKRANKEIVLNSQNTQEKRNLRSIIFLPINMFRIFVVITVVILSSLVLFGNFTELQSFKLNLVNQFLLCLLLLVNGIQGIKSANKRKRSIAYISLLLALFLLGLIAMTFLNTKIS